MVMILRDSLLKHQIKIMILHAKNHRPRKILSFFICFVILPREISANKKILAKFQITIAPVHSPVTSRGTYCFLISSSANQLIVSAMP